MPGDLIPYTGVSCSRNRHLSPTREKESRFRDWMVPGKSEGNSIYLVYDAATIRKKVRKAVTDSGPTEPNSVKPEVIQNLFTLMDVVSSKDTYDYFNEKYNNCEIRYGDLKKQLAEDIINFCSPIREQIIEYAANPDNLDKVAAAGAEKARASAATTMKEVRKLIGFR